MDYHRILRYSSNRGGKEFHIQEPDRFVRGISLSKVVTRHDVPPGLHDKDIGGVGGRSCTWQGNMAKPKSQRIRILDENVKKALKALASHEFPSIRSAAIHFNIPRETLDFTGAKHMEKPMNQLNTSPPARKKLWLTLSLVIQLQVIH
jgi:hypothetical protein